MERFARKRRLPLKFAAAFRLLLFWGAETLRDWMARPAKPESRQIRHELTLYPHAFWNWDEPSCRFLGVSLEKKRVWVRHLERLSDN